ncbi:replicative DNA helicase [Solibacillus sp. MA9]|uniref:DNA 5'-3' helicase n=1 Tax=Solibacillus palustris TaxID=2908203 RepID=A0ABS9U7T8_9BACL|nr:replicative DNA helicase [Solibacillus sp. MA9]MCH7320396.1 replicative DNA helicase [Solibacillus sp. MA9]
MKREFLEQSILATMLEENYLILDSGLTPEMFYGQHHRMLFAMMRELALENHPVDFMTLSARFEQITQIGLPYVTELIHFSNPEKFDAYVQLQREIWCEKQKGQILFQATEGDWAIPQIIHALDQTQLQGEIIDTTIANRLIDMENRPFEETTTPGLIVPHIQALAQLIDGFRPGEVTILAARPSMGKTDVMNNLALYAGWNGHLPIIFSLEMSTRTLLDRMIATAGNYSRLKLRNPKRYFSEEQAKNWLNVLNRVLKTKIHIDDRSHLSIAQIRAQARRIIRQHPALSPIIFIDYLQIIQSENDQDFSNIATTKISRSLKQMAKEFNCPVICLSQLNRNVESRGKKRPMMSDLRDSGSIEQDADLIVFLYRDSYYNNDLQDSGDLLELIVAKNRNGPTGTAYAFYNRNTGHVVSRE